MRYQLALEGLSERRIEVETPGAFRGARILVDGKPAAKGKKRGEYLVRSADGRESVVQLKSFFLDPVPQILWAGKTIKLAEPLKWYQWIWCGVPIVLVFGGGAIGGAVGFVGTSLNVQVLRSDMSTASRYASTACISIVVFGAYMITAALLLSAIGG